MTPAEALALVNLDRLCPGVVKVDALMLARFVLAAEGQAA